MVARVLVVQFNLVVSFSATLVGTSGGSVRANTLKPRPVRNFAPIVSTLEVPSHVILKGFYAQAPPVSRCYP